MGFQLSDDDLNASDELKFKDKEVVKFSITDFRENAQKGSLFLKVRVLSGEHTGKETELMVTKQDNAASRKRYAQFFMCFVNSGVWTREQLIAGSNEFRSLLGRVITATSSFRNHQGKDYQNWDHYQDEGVSGTTPTAAPATAQAPGTVAAAPTAAAPLSF